MLTHGSEPFHKLSVALRNPTSSVQLSLNSISNPAAVEFVEFIQYFGGLSVVVVVVDVVVVDVVVVGLVVVVVGAVVVVVGAVVVVVGAVVVVVGQLTKQQQSAQPA